METFMRIPGAAAPHNDSRPGVRGTSVQSDDKDSLLLKYVTCSKTQSTDI